MSCLVCSGPTDLVLDQVRDNRLGVPGAWSIVRCRDCGLEQIDPVPGQEELRAYYERYYNDAGEGSRFGALRARLFDSPLYRLFLALDGDVSFHARRGAGRLLDIGCNEGRGLEIHRRNGFTAEGHELNRRAAALARAKGFTVHEGALGDLPAGGFDRVVMSNVLEHMVDPRATLRAIHRLLAPGGEIWLSLPNASSALRATGRAWINWHVPFHLAHFTAERLEALLRESGFEPVERRNVTPSLWVAQTLIAWAGGGDARARLRNPVLVAAVMAVARGVCFPALWLANRLGRGDCLVVTARRA
jgi:SAM-dependent methyltransferase